MMKTLVTWSPPFRRPEILRGDMNEFLIPLFGHWEHAGMPERAALTAYAPQTASYVDGSTFCIKVDLPGVEPSEVELTVKDNQLTLTGERKAAPEQHNGNRFRQEVRYGPFVRTFTLPEGVTAEELRARYHNGVLEVVVPLPAARLPKKVPVQIVQSASVEPQTIAA
ncbi:MAG: Hsp20/alpha crystallin family protein [Deltaproteobacteria bacterium]|nr:Hsp20/alpha crystallin family protein [Deltaproteobacteria bacterium]